MSSESSSTRWLEFYADLLGWYTIMVRGVPQPSYSRGRSGQTSKQSGNVPRGMPSGEGRSWHVAVATQSRHSFDHSQVASRLRSQLKVCSTDGAKPFRIMLTSPARTLK